MTRPAFARWLSQTNEVTKTFLAAGQVPDLINLAGGLPEPSVWPVEELAEIAASAEHQIEGAGQDVAVAQIALFDERDGDSAADQIGVGVELVAAE